MKGLIGAYTSVFSFVYLVEVRALKMERSWNGYADK